MIPLVARGFNHSAERGRLVPGQREWLDLFLAAGVETFIWRPGDIGRDRDRAALTCYSDALERQAWNPIRSRRRTWRSATTPRNPRQPHTHPHRMRLRLDHHPPQRMPTKIPIRRLLNQRPTSLNPHITDVRGVRVRRWRSPLAEPPTRSARGAARVARHARPRFGLERPRVGGNPTRRRVSALLAERAAQASPRATAGLPEPSLTASCTALLIS